MKIVSEFYSKYPSCDINTDEGKSSFLKYYEKNVFNITSQFYEKIKKYDILNEDLLSHIVDEIMDEEFGFDVKNVSEFDLEAAAEKDAEYEENRVYAKEWLPFLP